MNICQDPGAWNPQLSIFSTLIVASIPVPCASGGDEPLEPPCHAFASASAAAGRDHGIQMSWPWEWLYYGIAGDGNVLHPIANYSDPCSSEVLPESPHNPRPLNAGTWIHSSLNQDPTLYLQPKRPAWFGFIIMLSTYDSFKTVDFGRPQVSPNAEP